MKHMKSCINCQSTRLYYAFSVSGYRLVECADCDYLGMYPQPSDAALAEIYGESYALLSENGDASEHASNLKKATAKHYLHLIERYRGRHGGRLLEIGCGSGDFLAAAADLGYEVTGTDYSPYACERARLQVVGRGTVLQGEIQDLPQHEMGAFDVCVLNDVVEHVRDPRALLSRIHTLLKSSGTLFIATPTLDSWSARLMKNRWMEFKPEHLHYFDQNTLHSLLFQTGYRRVLGLPGVKILSLEYVAAHFQRFSAGRFSSLAKLAALVPPRLRRKPFRIVASGMIALASAEALAARKKLSIVVPAYNEVATLDTLMSRLLAKEFGDFEVEIILVESNSRDGTREIAMRYRQDPRVRLILEERPRGKGHAVRAGLANASGDYVLIQDADLEYDLEDYEVLLKPLVDGSRAFVLGARHGGKIWKLRVFSGKRLVSALFNFGHWFFKTLINLSFGLDLQDPFTMYKVFRRDCLTGLTFNCNYFDFDYELLIKLVRNGYRPVEIPVNYRSRSFDEGKKVSIVRDPATWLRAVIRLRLQRRDPLTAIESLRQAEFQEPARAITAAKAHEP